MEGELSTERTVWRHKPYHNANKNEGVEGVVHDVGYKLKLNLKFGGKRKPSMLPLGITEVWLM